MGQQSGMWVGTIRPIKNFVSCRPKKYMGQAVSSQATLCHARAPFWAPLVAAHIGLALIWFRSKQFGLKLFNPMDQKLVLAMGLHRVRPPTFLYCKWNKNLELGLATTGSNDNGGGNGSHPLYLIATIVVVTILTPSAPTQPHPRCPSPTSQARGTTLPLPMQQIRPPNLNNMYSFTHSKPSLLGSTQNLESPTMNTQLISSISLAQSAALVKLDHTGCRLACCPVPRLWHTQVP